MHPNWRALSTVHFQRQLFVRSADEHDSSKQKDDYKNAEKNNLDYGANAKDFYDEIVSTPSTSKKSRKVKKTIIEHKPNKQNANNKSVKFVDIFKAAEVNDVDAVEQFVKVTEDVDDFVC